MLQTVETLTALMPLREGAASSMVTPALYQHYSTVRQPAVAHILTMNQIYDMRWVAVDTNYAPIVYHLYQLRSTT